MGEEAEVHKKVACVYHYPCPDGVFAAVAAHLYHKAIGCKVDFYANTVFSPLSLDSWNPESYDAVYMLDYIGPAGYAQMLAAKTKSCVTLQMCGLHASRLILLDHHKTAAECLAESELPSNIETTIDMARSGATIAWDYFHQKASTQGLELVQAKDRERVDSLFRYIEDADLWQWKLPGSKAFTSGLGDLQLEMDINRNGKLWSELLALEPAALIRKGERSLKAKDVALQRAMATSFVIELGGHGRCLCTATAQAVRADELKHLRSELGNRLARKSLKAGLRGIGAVVYTPSEDTSLVKVSLRSIGEEEDTTVISKVPASLHQVMLRMRVHARVTCFFGQAYGGGGHCAASSFLISKQDFATWLVD
eukprot:jgi/Chlat1/8183/Chrsp76S07622